MLQIPIYLPPDRLNSVLKISSHLPYSAGASGSRMSRKIWLVFFCLVGLAPAIAIKLAAPLASLVVEPPQGQSQAEPAFTLDESAKSDRLELPNAGAKPGIAVPAAQPMPAETASTGPKTVKKDTEQHWRNANAKLIPDASPPRRPKIKELKPSAVKYPTTQRAEVWHCRQDAMGSVLRSLDLSPRCNL
jgi:hypothetical protein